MSNMPDDFEKVCKQVADIFCSLQNIDDLYSFYHEEDCEEFIESYYDNVFDEVRKVADVEWIKNGLTKIVFSFKNISNYVVKIPFFESHEFAYNEEDDEYKEVCSYMYDSACLDILGCHLGNINGNDYCKLEQDIYFATYSYSLQDMFAGTYLAFTIDDKYPIYISKKINKPYYNAVTDHCKTPDDFSKDIVNSVKNLTKKYAGNNLDLPSYMRCDICKEYGEDALDALLNFMVKFKLNDFHTNNAGYDENGKFVFIDYSGYEE